MRVRPWFAHTERMNTTEHRPPDVFQRAGMASFAPAALSVLTAFFILVAEGDSDSLLPTAVVVAMLTGAAGIVWSICSIAMAVAALINPGGNPLKRAANDPRDAWTVLVANVALFAIWGVLIAIDMQLS